MKKLLIILLLIPILGTANTYYFSTTDGNDANTSVQAQNPATPWQTLTKLNSFMSSLAGDDIVRFKRGDVFPGFIIMNKAGSSGHVIRFATYSTGANPVITGFTDATIWTNLGSNIWETTSAISTLSTENIVTVSGVNTAMGRTPNPGSSLTINSHTSHTSATINSLTGTPNYSGAELIARMAATWIYARNLISSQSSSVLTTASNFPNPCSFTVYDYADGQGAFIQNALATLDQQNEWYYNPSTKKLDVFSVGSPTGVKIATIDSLVSITAGWITIDSLDFTGANTDCIQLSGATNVTITNCNIRYCGDMGIQMGDNNPNITVSGNTFRDIENSGITDICKSNNAGRTITNNSFVNINVVIGSMGSLDGQNMVLCLSNGTATGDLVQNNSIDSCGYSGIFTMGQSYTIQNNLVNHFCFFNTDGGGIYTGNHGTARNIIGNIVLNGMTNAAHGVYCDDNSTKLTITDNTVYNTVNGIYLHNAHDILVRNNTVWKCSSASLSMSHDSNDSTVRDTVRQNKFILANSGVSLGNCSFQNSFNSETIFGTSDSNYIACPITSDVNAWFTAQSGVTFNHYTLAQWQGAVSYDLHSAKSPRIVPSTDSTRFEYNATNSPVAVALGGTAYVDVTGAPYSGSITIPAWGSAFLIRTGNVNLSKKLFFHKR